MMAIAINTKEDYENGTSSPEALKERLDKIMLRIADQYPGLDRYRLEDMYWSLINAGYHYLSVGRIARQWLIQRILNEEIGHSSDSLVSAAPRQIKRAFARYVQ